MTSLRFSPSARADLREIWRYTVDTWSQLQADRYIAHIESTCARLAAGEIAGRPVHDLREGYFRITVESHFVFYKVNGPEDRIDVMRVLHQKMNLPSHLRSVK